MKHVQELGTNLGPAYAFFNDLIDNIKSSYKLLVFVDNFDLLPECAHLRPGRKAKGANSTRGAEIKIGG